MSGKNNLIVIENGQLSLYELDNKLVWNLGRPSEGNIPDICLHSLTISRRHGKFQNMDGVWYYVDYGGKNGTVRNNERIRGGISGRVKPVMLGDGDVFVFGGGDKAEINCKTVWALYYRQSVDSVWRVENTKGISDITFIDNGDVRKPERPLKKGTVINTRNGMAIYMGDITYLFGDIGVLTNER